MSLRSAPELQSLCHVLRQRASEHPRKRLFLFLGDGERESLALTFGELDQRARALAAWLQDEVGAGERALLLYPPGTDFACALFGCFYAGVVAVPAPLPDPDRLKRTLPRVESILRDAEPAVVLTTSASAAVRDAAGGRLRWLATEELDLELAAKWRKAELDADALAYLQFTSGSTSAPKGVMASHANLLHNCRAMQAAYGYAAGSVAVMWVPNFHDDGLVQGTVLPVYTGHRCVLMPPLAVVQKPERWLSAISRYRATHSGGPNFIYSLAARKVAPEGCRDLDLSSWRVAYNAAEPVRHDTLVAFHRTFARYGFRWDAFYPSYGLAEATLLVTARGRGGEPALCNVDAASLEHGRVVERFGDGAGQRTLVSSGRPVADTSLAIVDPGSGERCADGEVGEIRISNPSVARGYWRRPEATEEAFGAAVASANGAFLRTGDLGFVSGGELFVTGRWKDLIIVRGRNVYPQDVELTVERSHSLLRLGCSAAFSIEADGEERLVVAAEVDRGFRESDVDEVVGALRQAVAEEHELAPHAVTLLEPGSIPKTSSGKIQRRACREAFLGKTLSAVGGWTENRRQLEEAGSASAPKAVVPKPGREGLVEYLRRLVADVLRVPESAVETNRSLHRYGIDSLQDVELTNRAQAELGVDLPVTTFLRGQSLDELAARLAGSGAPEPIPRISRDRRGPRIALSFAQQRLWFLDRLAPHHHYNVPFLLRLTGTLDVAVLAAAMNEIGRRHEILRTTFAEREGEPHQVIHPAASRSLPQVDLTALGDGAEAEARRWTGEETRRPFHLETGPLLRAVLVRLGAAEYLLFLCLHHIVTDGWSLGVLYRELAALYEALSAGRPSPLPELTVQYADFAVWQRESWHGAALEGHLAYWRRQLADAPVLELATDRPRPAVQAFRGNGFDVRLPAGLAESLHRLGRRQGATLNMTLLAAFITLLSRATGQEKILLGSPSANRTRIEIEDLIGFFVNSLPLKGDLAPGPDGRPPTFRELLDRVREMALEAYEHQDLPFEMLVEALRSERDLSRNPLFQVAFVLQNVPLEARKLPGLELSPVVSAFETTRIDLEVHLWDVPEGLSGFCTYDRDLFDETTVRRLWRRYRALLEGIVAGSGETRTTSLPLFPAPAAHQVLVEWNDTANAAGASSVVGLFERQAGERPDAVAVRFAAPGPSEVVRSFGELDRRSDRLARYLRRLGVEPEVPVGVLTGRIPELLLGFLGTLKAGGVYVPLDPSYPAERLRLLLEDSRVLLVLTGGGPEHRLPVPGIRRLRLDDERIAAEDGGKVPAAVAAENLAYLIYTSGSTGRPKGVAASHRAFANLATFQVGLLEVGPCDRVLQFFSPGFDASLSEMAMALASGASLHMAPREALMPGPPLSRLLEEARVTTASFTPSSLAALDPAGLPELRALVVAGEACPPALARQWSVGRRLFNGYGPTEATIGSAMGRYRGGESVPIGRPVAGMQAYVMDAHLEPLPAGVPGELAAGGAGVARGYLGRPAQTAERFVPDPSGRTAGGRLYRTGDLVRWRADGRLEFLGRLDFQVKIRGFRIEPEEIEIALSEQPALREAVVEVREDRPGELRLVAYVVPKDGRAPAVPELRDELARRLPDYMVPSAIVVLDSLPLTAHGKVDRKALPAPAPPEVTDGERPRGRLESVLAGIWREVLGIAQVGAGQSFFDLGGHSLALNRVQARLKTALDRDVPITDLFRYPTIRSLAEHLAPGRREEPSAAPRAAPEASGEPIAIVALAGRFSGAGSVDELWRNLCDGVESISFFDDEELAATHPPELLADPHYVKAWGVVDGVELFDAAFFDLSPREAEILDPQQRLFLECAWEALELAGHDPRRYGGRIGVFAGAARSTYLSSNLSSHPKLVAGGGYDLEIANDKDFLATRVSYKLGLEGPAFAVQSACSSSLVAVGVACESLRAGRCEMALAGGVSVRVPQKSGYLHRAGMILSPDGHCRAFDAAARGTVGGSGAGVVLLKRLSDAVADGNPIHAVIRGFGLNNDGSLKVGYTAPGVEGQAAAISEALAEAGVSAETVGYVEAHGTGTELGDPIEIAALRQAFRRHTEKKGFCAIGSLKTNLGHLDTAAGVAGLIKAALVLEHARIPPSLHFEAPNPAIDFESSPFYVAADLAEWPAADATPRRAGVSSFGIGGTNAHAVLEEAPPAEPSGPSGAWQLLALSARTASALEAASARLAAHLRQHPEQELADVAFTLAVGRRELEHRRVVVGRDREEVAAALETGEGALTGEAAEPPPETAAEPEPAALARQPEALAALGRLWLRGAPVDWDAFYASERRRRVVLPTYPFERRRFWIEPAGAIAAGAALAAPAAMADPAPAAPHQRPDLEIPYEAPGDPRERALAEIWQEVLGIDGIGVRDDFFDLGGHSLLATQVLSRVREAWGVELTLARFFAAPTVAALAASVETAQRATAPPLVRRAEDRPPPLAFSQQRLWFVDRLTPGSPFYNMPAAVQLRGRLVTAALAAALSEIIRRHEALRTTFADAGGEPFQVIHEPAPHALPLVDLAALSPRAKASTARRLARGEAERPFDLAAGPLLRTVLVRLDREEHLLLLTQHHIVSDGWSIGVLHRELAALYGAAQRTSPALAVRSPLPELPVQYADYAVWQRRFLSGERLAEQLGYWKSLLQSAPKVFELPTDRPRPRAQSFRGAALPVRFPAQLLESLYAVGRRQQATLTMTLLAAFDTLLWRLTGQPKIVVGSPIAGRNHSHLERLIGLFVNTLAMVADLEGDPPFDEMLARVRQSWLAAHAYQELPFEKLVSELELDRDLSRNPLFQVVLALLNTPIEALELAGLELEPLPVDFSSTRCDLELHFWEGGEGLSGIAIYDTTLFDATTVRRLLAHYRTLLRELAGGAKSRLSELSWLAAGERQQLLREWNDTTWAGDGSSVVELFERQAAQRPEAVALAWEGLRASYGELGRRRGSLARRLRRQGVGPEVPVAVLAGNSPEMALAFLAILEAGGVYVPLDPDHPRARLSYLLEDTRASLVLVRAGLEDRLPADGTRRWRLDWRQAAGEDADAAPAAVTAANLAYLIYTSGSTGRPKGVAVSHGSFANFTSAQMRLLGLEPRDRFLQFSSPGFDASAAEMAVAFAAGTCLRMASREDMMPGPRLSRLLKDARVTVATLTPSTLSSLAPAALPELRVLAAVGEACGPELARRWAAGRRLFNGYGPTETTVGTAMGLYQGGERMPIGRPLANLQARVTDARLEPLPVGVPGELAAGGAGVARGYYRRPALTAERFVPDASGRTAGGRLYRTGDLARTQADGRLEFLGRFDTQVKVRGIRIELGEIAAALDELPAVREAVVLADEKGERLVAYLTRERSGAPEEPPVAAVRAALRERLPEHMVPSHFVVMEAFPRTTSGKVDRAALPAPESGRDRGTRFVAPGTPVEEMLAAIWEDLLGIAVGSEDDFFASGGHSLLATRMISRVRDVWGVDLPVRAVFEDPTLGELARRLETALGDGGEALEAPPVRPLPRELEEIPLSFAQQRLWFLDQLEPGSVYNIAGALRLSGEPHVEALRRAFGEVVRRHAVLRTRFAARQGRPVQVIAEPGTSWPLPLVDLAGVAGADSLLRLLLRREAQRPFDLRRGPVFRTTLLRLAGDRHVLLLAMHHIVSDGWSLGVMVRELGALYTAYRGGGDAGGLPPLPIRYADFAVWQRQWLRGRVLEEQLAHWRQRLAGVRPLELAADRPRPPVQSFRGAVRPFRLPPALGREVRRLGRRMEATPFMTLLAAFEVLLGRYSGQRDVAVGTPIANRNRSEIEDLVGCFVNTLVLRTDLGPDLTYRQLLAAVKDEALAAYAHQDLPFDHLVEALAPERDLSRTPLFQVMFILQNAPLSALRLPGLSIEPVTMESGVSAFDLTLSIDEQNEVGGLSGFLEYSTDLFDATTLARMAGHFEILLAQAVARPDTRIAELPLMTAPQRHQLQREWNDREGTEPERPIHELFAERAERAPDVIAVAGGNAQLSYGGLRRRAARLAGHLCSLAVRRVGVAVERSPELAVAFLGVLEAGCVYVPLDPAHPDERLAFLLADAGLEAVLTRSRFAPRFAGGAAVLCIDENWPDETRPAVARPPAESRLAYVIYTSGSTGRPKGVMVTHGSLSRLWAARRRSPCWPGGDKLRFTLSAAPVFDASVDQLLALAGGHTLEIVSEAVQRDATAYRQLLVDHRVDVLDVTPRELLLLLDAGAFVGAERWPTNVLFGGEAMTEALWKKLGAIPSVRSSNLYGPTEGTVEATAAVVTARTRRPHIGRPLPHVRAYVLDGRGRPSPLGVPGELAIAGAGVARGYLGRPGLTAERFVPEPGGSEAGARAYLTGDRVRYLAGGDLEFLGRLDTQLKLRGYRIEPGEIEAALLEHEAVADACVVGRGDALVAWVVPRTARDPAATGEAADFVGRDLRRHLESRLPEYMVPALFARLEALPTLPSGKADRSRLSRRPVPGSEASYQEPRSDLERRIAGVWQEVLGLDKVGVHDNFFEVGGHSLNIVQVRDKLDPGLSIVEMFQYPTIHALAGRLQRGAEPAPAPSRTAAPLPAGGAGSEIAVIAAAGRFPGAADVDELWRNLCDGVESVTFSSPDELAAAGVDRQLLERPDYVGAQALMDGVDLFDAGYFDVNPREAELMDPQHRLFLECVVEALEKAGHGGAEDVGIWAGASENAYFLSAFGAGPTEPMGFLQRTLGVGRDFVATRVSYKLNLKGPSLTVQTACSTSLVAVHQACRSLSAGECGVAVAGGVSVAVPRGQGYLYQEGGILSADGHCRAFDADAGGCVGGEGVGVVVLRRLADALADGDRVLAVIKGSAVNNDGAVKVGYTAPSVEGQAAVIRAAQRMAGVEPETVAYVEAHGTGTALGDPIEIAALNQVFANGGGTGAGRVAIGSIKTNIGHLDAAAGVAGLIKTVLALERGRLPPSLNFQAPNPRIDFGACRVQRQLGEWPPGAAPRRAGVSSFGIGGTNAHVVLEEAPARPAGGPSRPWQVITLSARTPAALDTATAELARHLRRQPDLSLADVAYTLAVGRRDLEHRRMVVARDLGEATAALENGRHLTRTPAAAEPPVVFLFPGQGAQYANMGLELYEEEPLFRRELDRAAEIALPHLGLDLRQVLYPRAGAREERSRRLEQTAHAQPALVAVEHALARLWMSWGVEPRNMIGHSVGEYVAACLAGVFSLEDTLALVALRGRLMQGLPSGAMLAVPLPEAELEEWTDRRGLDLAAVNGPALCVLSGAAAAIEAAAGELAARGAECRRLHTSHAFHSAAMEPILEPFRRRLEATARKPPQRPWISNLSGRRITAEEAVSSDYWVRHLRRTVRFADGLAALGREGDQVLLELGPGRSLGTLARRHPGIGRRATITASLPSAGATGSDQAFLLGTLGRLWLEDVAIDWPAFYGAEKRHRVVLPTYPFERRRYWVEPPAAAAAFPASAKTGDDGGRLARKSLDDWFYVPSWKQSPLAARLAPPAAGRALVFTAGDGLGDHLARRLRELGWRVTTVAPGGAFARDERGYVLDLRRAEDYRQLFRELAGSGGLPAEVFHLWSLAEGTDEEILERGFYSLLFLAQAIGEARHDEPLAVRVVTGPTRRVTGDEPLSPAKAAAAGLAMNLAAEYPGLRCLTVDVVPPAPGSPGGERLASQLVAEMAAAAAGGIVAYRGALRWRPTWESLRLDPADGRPRLRRRGVYLITGGLGGIGLALAEHLAASVRARLVLTGRSRPSAEKRKRIEQLEETGAEVLVRQADVTRRGEMAAVIREARERFGALDGVVHAAGVPAGGLIQRRTAAEAAAVLAPKVRGTRVLDELLEGEDLDFFVLCSSLSSELGAPGQADYCAANAFLDAYANARADGGDDGRRVVAVNWDAWEVGMAVDAYGAAARTAGEAVEHPLLDVCTAHGDAGGRVLVEVEGYTLRRSQAGAAPPPAAVAGAQGIANREGAEVFRRVLGAGLSQVIVSTVDLGAQLAASRELTVERLPERLPAAAHERPELANLYVAPRNPLEKTIAGLWQEVLGIARLGVEDDFRELGGHSLMGTQVLSRLRETLHVALPLGVFFQARNVAELSQAVEAHLGSPAGARAADLRPAPLVPLQPAGSQPPLFFVHGVDGNVLAYVDLSRELGSEQPFHAVRARGLEEGDEAPLSSIEEMAVLYLEAIREVDPQGPYQLGGWSMGGVVAFEVARQLSADGARVDRLVLIDSLIPVGEARLTEQDPEFWRGFARSLGLPGDLAAEIFGPSRLELRDLGAEARLALLLERAKTARAVPPQMKLSRVRALFDVFKAHIHAHESYRFRALDVPAVLFLASEGPAGKNRSLAEKWRQLVGDLDVREVPGDHFSMIRGDHARVLARHLRSTTRARTSPRS